MSAVNKKSGFTMVEIIAVLVIIGIMAAVSAPQFIDMSTEARNRASISGINECKASLSVAYSKAYLQQNGSDPTIAQVITSSALTIPGTNTFGDVIVNATVSGDTVTMTPISVDGTAVSGVSDTWDKPVQ